MASINKTRIFMLLLLKWRFQNNLKVKKKEVWIRELFLNKITFFNGQFAILKLILGFFFFFFFFPNNNGDNFSVWTDSLLVSSISYLILYKTLTTANTEKLSVTLNTLQLAILKSALQCHIEYVPQPSVAKLKKRIQ